MSEPTRPFEESWRYHSRKCQEHLDRVRLVHHHSLEAELRIGDLIRSALPPSDPRLDTERVQQIIHKQAFIDYFTRIDMYKNLLEKLMKQFGMGEQTPAQREQLKKATATTPPLLRSLISYEQRLGPPYALRLGSPELKFIIVANLMRNKFVHEGGQVNEALLKQLYEARGALPVSWRSARFTLGEKVPLSREMLESLHDALASLVERVGTRPLPTPR